jgi:outer membrane protein OmpA-like peptidoglycan-associated protein
VLTKKSKIMKTVINIKSTPKMQLALTILSLVMIGLVPLAAQDLGPAPASNGANQPQRTNYNRFSLGLKVTHLYDLKFTSFDLLTTGALANDPKGLNGSKTRFDLAGGLEANYFFSQLFSMDLGYEKGSMTGANEREYYESQVDFLTLGANISLKRAIRTEDYKFVPFARISLARASYDAERRFISDDVVFNTTNGTAIQYGFGLGCRYYFNHKWSAFAMSEFVTSTTDAWDGYDYGSGRDQMLKSSVGLKFAFGRNKHIDQTLAWQDNRVDQIQSKIDAQVNDAVKTINDSVNNTLATYMNRSEVKDSDEDGIVDKFDKCPNVSGLFSNNGCPPIEVQAKEEMKEVAAAAAIDKVSEKNEKSAAVSPVNANSNSGTSKLLNENERYRMKNEIMVEMYAIRFGFNSYQLNAEAYEHLNTVAVILRNNAGYGIKLIGYTDDLGTVEYNKQLAEQRANAVAEYLLSRGINKNRIQIEANGKKNPLDDNATKIGQANNRRVELKLQ